MSPNQNPEQIARDAIDGQLRASGWAVQSKDAINFNEGHGQAVREYTTDTGPADYVLFVDGQPVGVIEAKKETLGANITTAEIQTADYAAGTLKWIQSSGIPLRAKGRQPGRSRQSHRACGSRGGNHREHRSWARQFPRRRHCAREIAIDASRLRSVVYSGRSQCAKA
jgi:type I site-specific restriction endonuclease